MRPVLLAVLAIVAVACGRQASVDTGPSASRTADIRSPDQLIAAMQDRYAGKWYRTLTFVQKSSFLRAGAAPRVETWYEAVSIPGKLRIDLDNPAKGNGVLYRGDSVYQAQAGKITHRTTGRNILMTLGFDVYGQPPATTLAQLRAERIDLTLLRMDTLNGRRVFVVGAAPGDSVSNQFWVEADRLLFVRLIQSDAQRRRTQDIRFEKYVQHGGGWVAEEVRVLSAGRMVFHEEYTSVRVNVPLDDALFIPEKWSSAAHWFKP